ncbi:hypothetical protein [Microtetraspora sp. NBRC 16547]|uniref:hypothetical protein n=1 Tax=Microtetraspora sp. NBRC 16547 TaxID=3030993 RepID=UPI0024A01B1C|nr:hypothetical protein [Microtetraspora sp. NBRC 16547]GLX00740.1 hypothetical protein Misp02_48260 [Microtetraspora sp. NBRC 16547]
MSPGDYGTKAVPTYVAAEAETTPLPKIVVPAPPPPPRGGKGLGDLPMHVVYKSIAAVTAVAAAGVAGFVLLSGGEDDASATSAIAARSAVASPPASVPTTSAATTGGPAATPMTTPVASPLVASPAASSLASPATTPGAVTAVMQAALSDPRIPALPERDRQLGRLYGMAAKTRGALKDERSGVAFPRFAEEWKLTPASPFATRQMLPKIKGTSFRGMLVSCLVPIPVQASPRDTAFLAARWTLNHHPSGATIRWTASQPITVGERDGWLLGYTVNYTIKGKQRKAAAALALVDVPKDKPALVFVTIPDTQRKHWRDINTVMSRIRVL